MAANTDIISAACVFLEKLKQLHESGRNLPVPFVMSRINVLLEKKLPLLPSTATWSAKNGRCNKYRPPTKQQTAEFAEAVLASECLNTPVYMIPHRRQQQVAQFGRDIRALESLDAPVYVDIQWLHSDRGYVIKEFAATCVGAPTAWMMIKSPSAATPILCHNKCLVNRVHGIHWDVGFIGERQLRAMTRNLFDRNRRVLVKGTRHKVAILAEKLSVEKRLIESLDDCPDLKSLVEMYAVPACLYHRSLDKIMSCAAKNTRAITNHYDEEGWID